jgi:hypothetical protein
MFPLILLPISFLLMLIIGFFKGKNYCLIGPKYSGKTTLAHLMENGKLINDTVSTEEKTKISRKCIDLPGTKAYISSEWEAAVKGQEYTLYVFDLKKFADNIMYEENNYQETILFQLDMVLDWTENSKLIIIGTHLDKVGSELGHSISNEIKSKLLNRGRDSVKIVTGALNNVQSAEKLIEAIKKCME